MLLKLFSALRRHLAAMALPVVMMVCTTMATRLTHFLVNGGFECNLFVCSAYILGWASALSEGADLRSYQEDPASTRPGLLGRASPFHIKGLRFLSQEWAGTTVIEYAVRPVWAATPAAVMVFGDES